MNNSDLVPVKNGEVLTWKDVHPSRLEGSYEAIMQTILTMDDPHSGGAIVIEALVNKAIKEALSHE